MFQTMNINISNDRDRSRHLSIPTPSHASLKLAKLVPLCYAKCKSFLIQGEQQHVLLVIQHPTVCSHPHAVIWKWCHYTRALSTSREWSDEISAPNREGPKCEYRVVVASTCTGQMSQPLMFRVLQAIESILDLNVASPLWPARKS